MKFLQVGFLYIFCFVFCAKPEMTVDGSNTEVSATQRLKDYLQQSKYPENNWLIKPDDFSLENTPTLPGDASAAAKIEAILTDKISRGSLVVSFKVAIKQPGSYSFRTYLQSDGAKNLVHAMATRKLAPGSHTVEFLFYGKAIRDCGYFGRYTVPGIVGEKLPDDDASAASGKLHFLKAVYITKSYAREKFTDRDWDSKEKRAKIKALQAEIKAGQ